jgi:hypothetical protein
MSTDVFALIERQGRFLRSQQGGAFLVAIEPYLRVLTTTPQIAPHVAALREEAYELGREHRELETAPAATAYDIEYRYIAQVDPRQDDGDALGWKSIERLASRFDDPALVALLSRDTADLGRAGRIIHSVGEHMKTVAWQSQTRDAHSVELQFENVRLAQETNHARFLLAANAHGGVALLRLERVVEVLHGIERPDYELQPALAIDASRQIDLLRASVFGTLTASGSQSVDYVVSELARASEQLELDLQRRVDTVLSRLALVERYRARAEWHDRERLAALANTPKLAEGLLQHDFARYLFDQGLDPLTELRVGVLRADIVALGSQTFFVEAKRQTGKRPPEKVLAAAFRQTVDTATRLYADMRPHEAFVVIFRIGGLRLSLPSQPVELEGLRVYVRLIDLTPADLSGSQNPDNPRRVSLEDLEAIALAAAHDPNAVYDDDD